MGTPPPSATRSCTTTNGSPAATDYHSPPRVGSILASVRRLRQFVGVSATDTHARRGSAVEEAALLGLELVFGQCARVAQRGKLLELLDADALVARGVTGRQRYQPCVAGRLVEVA